MAWNENKEVSAQIQKQFPLHVYAPFDPAVDYYLNSNVTGMGQGFMVPMEYTNWREEVLSWKQSCYIHTGLNNAPTFKTKGPDALKFWQDISVNSYAKFPIGGVKHCICCDQQGRIMTHGVLLRLEEDEFVSFFLAPYAAYKFYAGGYDATGEFITDEFVFQVAGPLSLETLESAAQENLHDIRFARFRDSNIAGSDVRIARIGMAGTLAYEVHGKVEDAIKIYEAIWTAGQEYDIKKLGFYAYQLSHVEDGFPQGFRHFTYPWGEDKGMMEFLHLDKWTSQLHGSLGGDMSLRYRNPVELGWAKTIKFDHDFIGREALEKEVADPKRVVATLVWNPEDLADVYLSQFEQGETYAPMYANHFGQQHGYGILYADKILKDGKEIGISSGRNYSYYYRDMISLASLDVEYGEIGTEVTVLWGDEGTRQKEIRATVARFPYLNENRNENVDVSTIPSRFPAQ